MAYVDLNPVRARIAKDIEQCDHTSIAKRLEGSHANAFTQGFICSKVRRFPKRVYGSQRLRTPLRRVGAKGEGVFEKIGCGGEVPNP